ncbi:MAG: DUF1211 domain-containing protein [Candidatus Omnitrophica bacterium]|nr:DUF1211 domain-containing protein [Candidatus Omnitrophota bacterium]
MRFSYPRFYMGKERIETLVDGIFAIVMTLLVLAIVVPQRQVVMREIGFDELIMSRVQDIANYALSFVLLSIFWVQHHEQSHFIKRTDRIHLWINLLTLLFVALFPFSTSLVSQFPEKDLAEAIFGFNMFIVGILFAVNWAYATKGRHLVDGGITDEQIAIGRNICLLFLGISGLAILLSQSHPKISADVFWIIPAVMMAERLFKRRQKG